MANILTQEDDEQKRTTTWEPSSNIGQTGQQSQAPATQQSKPQGSGRFTNLQKYLKANEPAGEQLAGGIREKGQDYMSGVREGIESAQNVQQGIRGEQARLAKSGQYAQQIQDDAVAAAQQNLGDITQLRLGQNQATQLQGQGQQARQDLMSGLDPLQQFGERLGTEGGRYQVLQDVYGGAYKPTYSTGQRRLDQLFLQASPDTGLDQLQQEIGQTVTSGTQGLQDLGRGLGQGISDIRSGTVQAKQDILEAIGDFTADERGAFGQLYKDFGTEQAAREGELQSNMQRAINELRSGQLSPEVAAMLGITAPMDVSDLDLAKYAQEKIGLGDEDVTMADVYGRSDLQDRMKALAALSGTEESQYTGANEFGVAEGSDVTFDADAFADAAKKARDTYEKRFFNKNLWDATGRTPPTGYEDVTVLDEILSLSSGRTPTGTYTGGTALPSLIDPSLETFMPGADLLRIGDILGGGTVKFGGKPLYDLLDDPASRQQLEYSLNEVKAKEAANFIPAAGMTPQFEQLLNMFDQNRYRTLGIGSSPDDGTYTSF